MFYYYIDYIIIFLNIKISITLSHTHGNRTGIFSRKS